MRYTLNEIYQTFSFCDKILAIQQKANKDFHSILCPVGCGLSWRLERRQQGLPEEAVDVVNEDSDAEADESRAAASMTQDFAAHAEDRAARRRWWPPSIETLELLLRAGGQPSVVDGAGQAALLLICEGGR
ncbi:unnamed protein product [Effrenium voratum]|nr:unnamed protein product [Effrenium voratum]